MVKLLSMRSVVATGFVAVSLAAGAGIATAQPDTGILVNTTCTYEQIMSALNAERPDLAPEFNNSAFAQSLLRQFLAAPRPQRESMVQEGLQNPLLQDEIGPIMQVANSCSRY